MSIVGILDRRLLVGYVFTLITACATQPPRQTANLCALFEERPQWYSDSLAAQRRWGAPVALQMAILRHESGFRADARPPRDRLFGLLPWFRSSSAFGYAQAQDATWDWYLHKSGNRGADRDDFADATDFASWYLHQSLGMLGLSFQDTYHHYLAYHEGQLGYRRGDWRKKAWLQETARNVAQTRARFERQLAGCADRLDKATRTGSWWPF